MRAVRQTQKWEADHGPAHAVAYQHWHFILNKAKASLYDLDNDPKETTNLVGRAELAEIEKMLRAQLQSLTQGAPALANDKIVDEN